MFVHKSKFQEIGIYPDLNKMAAATSLTDGSTYGRTYAHEGNMAYWLYASKP